MEDLFTDTFLTALVAGGVLAAVPLLFASLGETISEQAGVLNVGLEGMMLSGAFFGAWGADVGGGWIPGVVTAMVAGSLL